jgi:hypothetical protein
VKATGRDDVQGKRKKRFLGLVQHLESDYLKVPPDKEEGNFFTHFCQDAALEDGI